MGVRGQSPLKLMLFRGQNRDKSPYRVCISLLKLATEKLTLKLLMHKNSIFSHISPSFIGVGALCPHPHRSMKAYISTKEEIMMT